MSTLHIEVKDESETEAGAITKAHMNIVRDAAVTVCIPSLSSERFNFINLEENGVVNSID